VRARAIRAATLARVLGLNHEPDPQLRDAALREWAQREAHSWEELTWFECTAAASGWLTVLALLALAAEGELDEDCVRDTCAAYLPWISLVATMLDSYADQAEDAVGEQHSYIAHYPCAEEAVARVCELVREAALQARALPDGARHTVILACMVAMYLSKDSSRAPQMRASTRSLAAAGGSLARALLPVLRIWRVVYAQRNE
jgi:tetraprenyl-beta-curcumene synthase